MLSFVWLGLVPALASLPPSSLPLLRSGRGVGLCRLFPFPGAGLAAPSLCGDCSAALPQAALSCHFLDSNLPQFEIFLKYGREKSQTARKFYWNSIGGKQSHRGFGRSWRTELDRVEAPRGGRSHDTASAPENTTRDAAAEFLSCYPPIVKLHRSCRRTL